MLSALLNILWIVLGGLCLAIGWAFAGVIMILTIVGIPFARSAFNFALFSLWPFGRKVVDRKEFTGEDDIGTGSLGIIGNVVWFLLAGWWLALGHLISAFLLALTIIGIPFAWQHIKLAGFALWPIGRMIVDADPDDPSPFHVERPAPVMLPKE